MPDRILEAEDDGSAGRPTQPRSGRGGGPCGLPVGAPLGFCERLSSHLRTADPVILDAAARDFRGVWGSEHEYMVDQLAEQVPPLLAWVLACCDPAALRAGYEAGRLRVWSIPLELGRCMVFESYRGEPVVSRAEMIVEPDESEPDAPCLVCGADDWIMTAHNYDGEPLGCDRCGFGAGDEWAPG